MRTLPPARRRTRIAVLGRRNPWIARQKVGCRTQAKQAVACEAPSGISRIQIASCADCLPTSPRAARHPRPPAPADRSCGPASGRAVGQAAGLQPRPAGPAGSDVSAVAKCQADTPDLISAVGGGLWCQLRPA